MPFAHKVSWLGAGPEIPDLVPNIPPERPRWPGGDPSRPGPLQDPSPDQFPPGQPEVPPQVIPSVRAAHAIAFINVRCMSSSAPGGAAPPGAIKRHHPQGGLPAGRPMGAVENPSGDSNTVDAGIPRYGSIQHW